MNLNRTGTSIPTKPETPDGFSAASFDSRRDGQRRARSLVSSHYENFTVALPGLPADRFQDLCNIYYFCRFADDCADEINEPDRSRRALEDLRRAVDDLFERGRADHPVTRILEPTLERRPLSKQPFLDLISAFLQDLDVARYETFRDLLDYCRRSANPVGRLVLQVFDRFEQHTCYYSDFTCTALQLTNFWADIELDLDRDRVYIPQEDLERFNVERDSLHQRVMTDELQAVLALEVERTRDWFRCGWNLTEEVGGALAMMVELYNAGGWAVLDKLEEREFEVFERRWTLSGYEKLLLVLRGLWRFGGGRSHPPR